VPETQKTESFQVIRKDKKLIVFPILRGFFLAASCRLAHRSAFPVENLRSAPE
jgi:hypothetical protein